MAPWVDLQRVDRFPQEILYPNDTRRWRGSLRHGRRRGGDPHFQIHPQAGRWSLPEPSFYVRALRNLLVDALRRDRRQPRIRVLLAHRARRPRRTQFCASHTGVHAPCGAYTAGCFTPAEACGINFVRQPTGGTSTEIARRLPSGSKIMGTWDQHTCFVRRRRSTPVFPLGCMLRVLRWAYVTGWATTRIDGDSADHWRPHPSACGNHGIAVGHQLRYWCAGRDARGVPAGPRFSHSRADGCRQGLVRRRPRCSHDRRWTSPPAEPSPEHWRSSLSQAQSDSARGHAEMPPSAAGALPSRRRLGGR